MFKVSLMELRLTLLVVNKLLGKDASPPIFPDLEDRTAADLLTTIFKEKISAIREGLTDSEESYASDPFVFRGGVLSHFIPETEEQLRNVISRSKLISACVDIHSNQDRHGLPEHSHPCYSSHHEHQFTRNKTRNKYSLPYLAGIACW